MSTTFTPGPWTDHGGYIGTKTHHLCEVFDAVGHDWVANANLIAAAPDLFEAAVAVSDWIAELGRFSQRGEQPHPVFQTLAAALAKARGEQS